MKIKPGRCRGNWTKTTQRYYGITSEEENSPDIQFKNIKTFLPQDVFPISITEKCINVTSHGNVPKNMGDDGVRLNGTIELKKCWVMMGSD